MGWFTASRDRFSSDPIKDWVEPGRWLEDLGLPPSHLSAIRAAFPPARPPARTSIALDGCTVAIEICVDGRSEWLRYHSAFHSEGLALARTIARAVADNATTAHVRETASAANEYLE